MSSEPSTRRALAAGAVVGRIRTGRAPSEPNAPGGARRLFARLLERQAELAAVALSLLVCGVVARLLVG